MSAGTRKRVALPIVAALSALGLMVVASSAMAGHARPQSATPLYAPFVIAHKQCGVAGNLPNTSHLGGLPFPSCEIGGAGTGGPTSPNLTTGTPTGPAPAPAQGTAFVRLKVLTGDVGITSVGTDVRCRNGIPTLPCSAAGSNGAQTTRDYIGEVQGTATIRITDENNGTGSTHATVVDLPFSVDGDCVENPGNGPLGAPIGGTCSTDTTANAVVPGAAVAGKRGIVEIGQLTVNDAGPDGLNSSADNSIFVKQGIFVP